MAHLYHVAMLNCGPGKTVYKDAFVKRSGPLDFGDDFAGFREFLHKEFFQEHEHGPVILSLTDHGERPDEPEESTENKEA